MKLRRTWFLGLCALALGACADDPTAAPGGPRLVTGPDGIDSARYHTRIGPGGTLLPGQLSTATVMMQNVGTTVWTPEKVYRLGSQNPQDNIDWGVHRVGLQQDSVRPGGYATFTFAVRAPAIPGTYDFQWRMVRELQWWFGVRSTNTTVTVDWPGNALVNYRYGDCLDPVAPAAHATLGVALVPCAPREQRQHIVHDLTRRTLESEMGGQTYCLEYAAGAEGTPVRLAGCSGSDAQKWFQQSGGRYSSQLAADRCLDVREVPGTVPPLGQIVTRACDRSDSQLWRRSEFGTGGSTVGVTYAYDQRLCVGADAAGALLVDCGSDRSQRITRTPGKEMRINEQCLDGTGGTPGSAVLLRACSGSPRQQWVLDGEGRIRDPNGGYCMFPAGGSAARGARMELAACEGTWNQWFVRGAEGTWLREVSGDEQRGLLRTTLPGPLVVRALSSAGVPQANRSVAFTVSTGGGSVSAAVVRTDAQGYAQVSWTLGANEGVHTVTAVLRDEGAAVALTARATAQTPVVKTLYLVPADRARDPAYEPAIEGALRRVRDWYVDHTGGTTYTLAPAPVSVYNTPHAESWYRDNPNGTDSGDWYINNILQDAKTIAGVRENDPYVRWVIYIDSQPSCKLAQRAGSARAGVVYLDRRDLQGLAGQPQQILCDPPTQWPPARWQGGLAHELGHAFGLQHPATCDDPDSANTPCPGDVVMGSGMYNFPNTALSQADRDRLKLSLYFSR